MGAWKFVLSEEEMRDVTAYLRQLGSEAGQGTSPEMEPLI